MAKKGTNGDLKNYIYGLLKERLVTCKYIPGSIINESQLAAEFELSRTPIREALYRLEQDGFVQIMPKKGIYVSDITVQDILYIFQARIEIEPIALKMAGPYMQRGNIEDWLKIFSEEEPDLEKAFWQDMEMHAYMVQHCGNPFIVDMMHKVFAQSCRVTIASKQTDFKIHNARIEHKQILELMLRGEYDKAADAMRTHLGACKEYSLNFFSTQQIQVSTSDWSMKGSSLYTLLKTY